MILVEKLCSLRAGLLCGLAAAFALIAPSGAYAQATIAPVSAWCWFADPRAVEYDDRAVFGWVDGLGNIMVGDDAGIRVVLDPELHRDDHANPAFYVRKDGRLMAFWSSHSGPELRYRTATDHSLTSWGPVQTAPANPPGTHPNYTYANPHRIGDTLYLFWSAGGHVAYATSTDDGDTWSESVRLFDDSSAHVRYIKYRAVGREIHMAWTIGHPRTWASSVYHAIIRDGQIWQQDGTKIGEVGTPISSQAGDVVYDSAAGGAGAWIHDLAVTGGRAIITYATFPTIEDHTYRYARWDGAGWADEHVTMAGPSFNPNRKEVHYSGGITINPRNTGTVYLSRKVDGEFEIERWIRHPDRWERQPITSGSSVPNVRPFPVAGGLAWMRGEYPNYWNYKTDIQWLAPGESVRPPDDAQPTARPPGAPAATLPPAPAPTPAAAPTPASATPVIRSTQPRARKRSCRRHRQAWRESHSRRAARRYRRCRARIQGRRHPANRAAGEGIIRLSAQR